MEIIAVILALVILTALIVKMAAGGKVVGWNALPGEFEDNNIEPDSGIDLKESGKDSQ